MSASNEPGLDVVVCRGCCCGTDKHPDADHEAQLGDLRQAVADTATAQLLVADCLGACEHSNVVLLRRRGAAYGPRRMWFGQVLATDDTEAMCAWIRRGGPSTEDPAVRAVPARLGRLRMPEPRAADTGRARPDKRRLG